MEETVKTVRGPDLQLVPSGVTKSNGDIFHLRCLRHHMNHDSPFNLVAL